MLRIVGYVLLRVEISEAGDAHVPYQSSGGSVCGLQGGDDSVLAVAQAWECGVLVVLDRP